MAETITPKGVRITYPDSLRVEAASEAPGWAAPGTAATRAPAGGDWSVLLRDAGFEVFDKVVISSDGPAILRAAPGSAAPEIHVPVQPDQEALLLIESEGVYHWEYPAPSAGPSDLRLAPDAEQTRRFVLDPAATTPDTTPATRGPIFDWISDTRIFHAIIVRFVLGPAAATIARAVDGDGPFGLCRIAGDDATQWRPTGTPLAPAPGAMKVLLLVHGTFSSTRGSFSDLLTHAEGRNFLTRAQENYDLVLGFEHPTLSAPTTENARILADELEQMKLPTGATIDAVAFSRGGLVLRGLFEKELKTRDKLNFNPGRAVFVGCTNGGTHLADSKNWGALTDLYTTLALSTAGAAAGVPVLGAASAFAATAVPIIGRFVQSLAIAAVQDNYVPGLASMKPDGEVVRELNAGEGKTAAPGYYAVTANYNPGDEGQANSNGALKALNRIADDLFVAENDLVVDTKLMTTFWPQMQVGAVEDFGDTHDVFHTSYFASPRVAGKTAEWLGMATLHEAAEPVRGPFDFSPFDGLAAGGGTTRGFGPADGAVEFGGAIFGDGASELRAPIAPGQAEPPPLAGAAQDTLELEGARVSCDVAATMPPTIPTGGEAILSITVSRGDVTIKAGPTAAMQQTELIVQEPLSVTVRAIANCKLVDGAGEQTSVLRQMNVPRNEDGTNIAEFRVKAGDTPGDARIAISATQRGRAVVDFELLPQIVPSTGELVVQQSARLSASPAPSTLLMRIYQSKINDEKWNFHFAVDCAEASLKLDYDATIPVNPAAFTNEWLTKIEQVVRSKNDIEGRTRQLMAHGIEVGKTMIPAQVREAIWANRDRIGAIQVVSDDSLVPWELASITGPNREDRHFLAEFGLVRWISNVWPPDELRMRPDKMHVFAPVYSGGSALPGAQAEAAEFLKNFPGASALKTSRSEWTSFLEGGSAVDVLHVACHGAVSGQTTQTAGLYLTVRPDDVFEQVELSAALNLEPNSRPIVFLNACQSGRPGFGIAGIGGFARAFLESKPGAAVVVAPLWSVGDVPASTFSMTFYDRLRKNDTVVDAVKAARKKAREKDTQLTWLSYSVYADPFARVVEPVWSEQAQNAGGGP